MRDNDPRKPFADLVRKHGLDPEWIAADGLSNEGYFAFVRTDAGTTRRRTLDDSAPKAWATWPPALLAEPTFSAALSQANQRLRRFHDKEVTP